MLYDSKVRPDYPISDGIICIRLDCHTIFSCFAETDEGDDFTMKDFPAIRHLFRLGGVQISDGYVTVFFYGGVIL